jgi:hypothetical protein
VAGVIMTYKTAIQEYVHQLRNEQGKNAHGEYATAIWYELKGYTSTPVSHKTYKISSREALEIMLKVKQIIDAE